MNTQRETKERENVPAGRTKIKTYTLKKIGKLSEYDTGKQYADWIEESLKLSADVNPPAPEG